MVVAQLRRGVTLPTSRLQANGTAMGCVCGDGGDGWLGFAVYYLGEAKKRACASDPRLLSGGCKWWWYLIDAVSRSVHIETLT